MAVRASRFLLWLALAAAVGIAAFGVLVWRAVDVTNSPAAEASRVFADAKAAFGDAAPLVRREADGTLAHRDAEPPAAPDPITSIQVLSYRAPTGRLIRATVPRVRVDHVMAFNWKFLVPLSIINVLVTALLLKVVQTLGLAPAPGLEADLVANIPQTAVLLVGNLVIIAGALAVLRSTGRRERAVEVGQQGHEERARAAAGD